MPIVHYIIYKILIVSYPKIILGLTENFSGYVLEKTKIESVQPSILICSIRSK